MQILPYAGAFTAPGFIDISGRGQRTLYVWGDFAGGTPQVQAVVPHPDGEELFAVSDAQPKVLQDDVDEVQVGEPSEDPVPILQLSSRGFITFDMRAPIVRLLLIDCTTDPDLKFWIG